MGDSAGGAEAHEQGVDERPSQAVLDAARAAAAGQTCVSPDDLLPGALLRLASCWARRTCCAVKQSWGSDRLHNLAAHSGARHHEHFCALPPGSVSFDEDIVGHAGAGYLWPPPRRANGFVPRHSLAPPLAQADAPDAAWEEEVASPAAAEDAGDAFARDPEVHALPRVGMISSCLPRNGLFLCLAFARRVRVRCLPSALPAASAGY